MNTIFKKFYIALFIVAAAFTACKPKVNEETVKMLTEEVAKLEEAATGTKTSCEKLEADHKMWADSSAKLMADTSFAAKYKAFDTKHMDLLNADKASLAKQDSIIGGLKAGIEEYKAGKKDEMAIKAAFEAAKAELTAIAAAHTTAESAHASMASEYTTLVTEASAKSKPADDKGKKAAVKGKK
ncbi:MAG: hypothetical protein EAZ97_06435 [Bacteroidetes bacterium]|nr:MAG: hypothetical protein EAZ97_06435 [Bacteroidota bacterium]